MKKVLLWGMGREYESLLNLIRFEIYKGNIYVEAIVVREQDKYCAYKDGFPLITKNEISKFQYDYIIVTSFKFFGEIVKEAISYGIDRNQIIDGHKLQLPYFDFLKYIELIENPVTILSNDCWGGQVYHYLGLPFTSPLINIRWDDEEYYKFILDPVFYLKTDLKMVREGSLEKELYPIGQLGDEKKNVSLNLIHYLNFQEAKTQWDRRVKRINWDNIFIKMSFLDNGTIDKKELYIDAFEKISYKKILFYYGHTEIQDSLRSGRYIWYNTMIKGTGKNFCYADYLRLNYEWDMDVFELFLRGGSKCSRYYTPSSEEGSMKNDTISHSESHGK